MSNDLTPQTICLIDDDRIYQFTAKRIIELVNPEQKVLAFLNGKEAIDYFNQPSISANDLPDVIFLDINMPVMNGWEFLDSFKALHKNLSKKITIYMVSSSIDEKDRARSEGFEIVKDYIEKPINQQMMREILHAASKRS